MKNLLLLLAVMLAIQTAHAQVASCEYFFDTDPGAGNGTAISIATADSVILATTVPTVGLSVGFHILYFRFRDVNGVYSLYEGRSFYIQPVITANTSQLTDAEYFFDTDPGLGNGTAFTVTSGDSLVISTPVPTTALSNGFHKLFVRAKNADGRWSLYEGRSFYIQGAPTPNASQLTDAEYFFDTDPGIGNGTAFTVTAGDSIVIATTVATAALSDGFHKLFVRARNADGRWSHYEGRSFYLQQPNPNTSQVQLTRAEYFFDTEMGQGNALPLTVTPGDSIDMSVLIPESLAMGAHTLVMRVMNSNNKWSHNESRQFLVGWPSVPEIDPNTTALFQNYPNPFTGTTTIYYNLVKEEDVTITITNLLGEVVKVIVAGKSPPGEHSVEISKSELQGGYYFYKMVAGEFTDTKEMVLVK
jgi:hypothetical protein